MPNPLYPDDDPANADTSDAPLGLPVAREPLRLTVHPRSDLTPSPPEPVAEPAIQPSVEPAYKLTPVDYDPFERAAERTRRSVSERESKPARLPEYLSAMFVHNAAIAPVQAAADLTNQALGGTFVSNDPANVGKAVAAAGLAGTGGIAGAPKGAIGSGMVREVEAPKPAPIFYSAVENAVNNIKQP